MVDFRWRMTKLCTLQQMEELIFGQRFLWIFAIIFDVLIDTHKNHRIFIELTYSTCQVRYIVVYKKCAVGL